ncbi:MAG: carboxymuconolactone decarboxylase family protein [Chitinophagaceae bacterium]
MQQRINMPAVLPAAYKAMIQFSNQVTLTHLSQIQKELIKIRASQINGCAFCLDMHTKDARKLGETEQRIYTLSAWRDTAYFTREERAILALTETVTLISSHVPDEVYSSAQLVLTAEQIAEVIMATIVINAWNRIAISTHMMPPLG